MFYESELSFLQLFLKNLHLDFHLITRENSPFPICDMGLRDLLSIKTTLWNSSDIFGNQFLTNTIYRVTDSFFCHYVFFLLPNADPETAMIIGPYTATNVSDKTIISFMERSFLPSQLLPHIIKYYGNVPILWDDGPLFSALDAFGQIIWGGPDSFRVSSLEYRYPDTFVPPDSHYASHDPDNLYSMEILEKRYQQENQLLHAISLGQTEKATEIISTFSFGLVEPRLTDQISNLKNYMIIANTLMRKAAEQGMVHPLHVDRLSGHFARKIEMMSHPSDVSRLSREMVHKYCLLVKNHSLKAYSLPVQKVISNIDYDLTADLSLKAQAALLNMNPSYLSTLFKKETGTTLTDFVNQKRVEHAILLLNSTPMQIQTIARECGIPDVNYFSKTFKKFIGQTPIEYRKTITQPPLP